jgi:hypothetical protein
MPQRSLWVKIKRLMAGRQRWCPSKNLATGEDDRQHGRRELSWAIGRTSYRCSKVQFSKALIRYFNVSEPYLSFKLTTTVPVT